MIEPGVMHKSGHARCGGCLALVDRCAGGRRRRKAERWTYSGPHRLGWVCESCARWVYFSEPPRGQSVAAKDLVVSRQIVSRGPPGARRATVRFSRRLRNDRRRAVQAARSAPNLDALSPTDYRRYVSRLE